MTGKILVPLKRRDRIEEVIPYLEEVASSGMRVVFLIPYPVKSWLYLRDHWVTTESAREAMLKGRKIMEAYSWELQKALAEQKVGLAREGLQRRKVEVAVDVYTGSLRRVIGDYSVNGNVHLVMMRARGSHLLMRLFSRTIFLFGLFKRPSSSPALLYRRLRFVSLGLPPLRERKENISALAHFFLKRFSLEAKKNFTEIAGEAQERLLAYDWPGNVRELANVMERAVVLGQGPKVTLQDLPPRIASAKPGIRSDSLSYRETTKSNEGW